MPDRQDDRRVNTTAAERYFVHIESLDTCCAFSQAGRKTIARANSSVQFTNPISPIDDKIVEPGGFENSDVEVRMEEDGKELKEAAET